MFLWNAVNEASFSYRTGGVLTRPDGIEYGIMPKVIVKFPQQQLFGQTHDKHLLFQLAKGETLIGRGEDCVLRLPNVSVSRQHCRIMPPYDADAMARWLLLR